MARIFRKRPFAVLTLVGLVAVSIAAQTVTPAAVSLRAAGTQQFTSSIANCFWSTPIGTVNLAGYYQAPLVIPFAISTTATCATQTQSASASVTLTPSSLPVAGLEYIRGGNFAGSIIVLAIQAPLFAANGQFGINGSPLKCPTAGCSGILLLPNGDGTVMPDINSAVYPTKDTLLSGSCNYVKSTNGTTAYTYAFGPVCKVLTKYTEGMTFTLWVDATCATSCTLNIDGLGIVSIKMPDTATDPNGALIQFQPQTVTYTPAIGGSGFVFTLRP